MLMDNFLNVYKKLFMRVPVNYAWLIQYNSFSHAAYGHRNLHYIVIGVDDMSKFMNNLMFIYLPPSHWLK